MQHSRTRRSSDDFDALTATATRPRERDALVKQTQAAHAAALSSHARTHALTRPEDAGKSGSPSSPPGVPSPSRVSLASAGSTSPVRAPPGDAAAASHTMKIVRPAVLPAATPAARPAAHTSTLPAPVSRPLPGAYPPATHSSAAHVMQTPGMLAQPTPMPARGAAPPPDAFARSAASMSSTTGHMRSRQVSLPSEGDDARNAKAYKVLGIERDRAHTFAHPPAAPGAAPAAQPSRDTSSGSFIGSITSTLMRPFRTSPGIDAAPPPPPPHRTPLQPRHSAAEMTASRGAAVTSATREGALALAAAAASPPSAAAPAPSYAKALKVLGLHDAAAVEIADAQRVRVEADYVTALRSKGAPTTLPPDLSARMLASNIFLSPATAQVSASIVGASLRVDGATTLTHTPYAVYLIRVRCGARVWMVQRRYREFAALHDSLVGVVPTLRMPSLPGRVLGLSMRLFQSPDVVRRRIGELQAYLRVIVRIHEAWKCDDLLSFLDDAQNTLQLQAAYARALRMTQALAVGAATARTATDARAAELAAKRAELETLQARMHSIAMQLHVQYGGEAEDALDASAAAGKTGSSSTPSRRASEDDRGSNTDGFVSAHSSDTEGPPRSSHVRHSAAPSVALPRRSLESFTSGAGDLTMLDSHAERALAAATSHTRRLNAFAKRLEAMQARASSPALQTNRITHAALIALANASDATRSIDAVMRTHTFGAAARAAAVSASSGNVRPNSFGGTSAHDASRVVRAASASAAGAVSGTHTLATVFTDQDLDDVVSVILGALPGDDDAARASMRSGTFMSRASSYAASAARGGSVSASFSRSTTHSFYAALFARTAAAGRASMAASVRAAPSTAARVKAVVPGRARRALSDTDLLPLAAAIAALTRTYTDAAPTSSSTDAATEGAGARVEVAHRECLSTVAFDEDARILSRIMEAVPLAPGHPLCANVDHLLAHVGPTHESNERRWEIATFVTRLLRSMCALEAFAVGATANRTYLPDSVIDVVVVPAASTQRQAWPFAQAGGSPRSDTPPSPILSPAPSPASSMGGAASRPWFSRVNDALCKAAAVYSPPTHGAPATRGASAPPTRSTTPSAPSRDTSSRSSVATDTVPPLASTPLAASASQSITRDLANIMDVRVPTPTPGAAGPAGKVPVRRGKSHEPGNARNNAAVQANLRLHTLSDVFDLSNDSTQSRRACEGWDAYSKALNDALAIGKRLSSGTHASASVIRKGSAATAVMRVHSHALNAAVARARAFTGDVLMRSGSDASIASGADGSTAPGTVPQDVRRASVSSAHSSHAGAPLRSSASVGSSKGSPARSVRQLPPDVLLRTATLISAARALADAAALDTTGTTGSYKRGDRWGEFLAHIAAPPYIAMVARMMEEESKPAGDACTTSDAAPTAATMRGAPISLPMWATSSTGARFNVRNVHFHLADDEALDTGAAAHAHSTPRATLQCMIDNVHVRITCVDARVYPEYVAPQDDGATYTPTTAPVSPHERPAGHHATVNSCADMEIVYANAVEDIAAALDACSSAAVTITDAHATASHPIAVSASSSQAIASVIVRLPASDPLGLRFALSGKTMHARQSRMFAAAAAPQCAPLNPHLTVHAGTDKACAQATAALVFQGPAAVTGVLRLPFMHARTSNASLRTPHAAVALAGYMCKAGEPAGVRLSRSQLFKRSYILVSAWLRFEAPTQLQRATAATHTHAYTDAAAQSQTDVGAGIVTSSSLSHVTLLNDTCLHEYGTPQFASASLPTPSNSPWWEAIAPQDARNDARTLPRRALLGMLVALFVEAAKRALPRGDAKPRSEPSWARFLPASGIFTHPLQVLTAFVGVYSLLDFSMWAVSIYGFTPLATYLDALAPGGVLHATAVQSRAGARLDAIASACVAAVASSPVLESRSAASHVRTLDDAHSRGSGNGSRGGRFPRLSGSSSWRARLGVSGATPQVFVDMHTPTAMEAAAVDLADALADDVDAADGWTEDGSGSYVGNGTVSIADAADTGMCMLARMSTFMPSNISARFVTDMGVLPRAASGEDPAVAARTMPATGAMPVPLPHVLYAASAQNARGCAALIPDALTVVVTRFMSYAARAAGCGAVDESSACEAFAYSGAFAHVPHSASLALRVNGISMHVADVLQPWSNVAAAVDAAHVGALVHACALARRALARAAQTAFTTGGSGSLPLAAEVFPICHGLYARGDGYRQDLLIHPCTPHPHARSVDSTEQQIHAPRMSTEDMHAMSVALEREHCVSDRNRIFCSPVSVGARISTRLSSAAALAMLLRSDTPTYIPPSAFVSSPPRGGGAPGGARSVSVDVSTYTHSNSDASAFDMGSSSTVSVRASSSVSDVATGAQVYSASPAISRSIAALNVDPIPLSLSLEYADLVAHNRYTREGIVAVISRVVGGLGVAPLGALGAAVRDLLGGFSPHAGSAPPPSPGPLVSYDAYAATVPVPRMGSIVNAVIKHFFFGLRFLLAAHPSVFAVARDHLQHPVVALAGHTPLYPFIPVPAAAQPSAGAFARAIAAAEAYVHRVSMEVFQVVAKATAASSTGAVTPVLAADASTMLLGMHAAHAVECVSGNVLLTPATPIVLPVQRHRASRASDAPPVQLSSMLPAMAGPVPSVLLTISAGAAAAPGFVPPSPVGGTRHRATSLSSTSSSSTSTSVHAIAPAVSQRAVAVYGSASFSAALKSSGASFIAEHEVAGDGADHATGLYDADGMLSPRGAFPVVPVAPLFTAAQAAALADIHAAADAAVAVVQASPSYRCEIVLPPTLLLVPATLAQDETVAALYAMFPTHVTNILSSVAQHMCAEVTLSVVRKLSRGATSARRKTSAASATSSVSSVSGMDVVSSMTSPLASFMAMRKDSGAQLSPHTSAHSSPGEASPLAPRTPHGAHASPTTSSASKAAPSSSSASGGMVALLQARQQQLKAKTAAPAAAATPSHAEAAKPSAVTSVSPVHTPAPTLVVDTRPPLPAVPPTAVVHAAAPSGHAPVASSHAPPQAPSHGLSRPHAIPQPLQHVVQAGSQPPLPSSRASVGSSASGSPVKGPGHTPPALDTVDGAHRHRESRVSDVSGGGSASVRSYSNAGVAAPPLPHAHVHMYPHARAPMPRPHAHAHAYAAAPPGTFPPRPVSGATSPPYRTARYSSDGTHGTAPSTPSYGHYSGQGGYGTPGSHGGGGHMVSPTGHPGNGGPSGAYTPAGWSPAHSYMPSPQHGGMSGPHMAPALPLSAAAGGGLYVDMNAPGAVSTQLPPGYTMSVAPMGMPMQAMPMMGMQMVPTFVQTPTGIQQVLMPMHTGGGYPGGPMMMQHPGMYAPGGMYAQSPGGSYMYMQQNMAMSPMAMSIAATSSEQVSPQASPHLEAGSESAGSGVYSPASLGLPDVLNGYRVAHYVMSEGGLPLPIVNGENGTQYTMLLPVELAAAWSSARASEASNAGEEVHPNTSTAAHESSTSDSGFVPPSPPHASESAPAPAPAPVEAVAPPPAPAPAPTPEPEVSPVSAPAPAAADLVPSALAQVVAPAQAPTIFAPTTPASLSSPPLVPQEVLEGGGEWGDLMLGDPAIASATKASASTPGAAGSPARGVEYAATTGNDARATPGRSMGYERAPHSSTGGGRHESARDADRHFARQGDGYSDRSGAAYAGDRDYRQTQHHRGGGRTPDHSRHHGGGGGGSRRDDGGAHHWSPAHDRGEDDGHPEGGGRGGHRGHGRGPPSGGGSGREGGARDGGGRGGRGGSSGGGGSGRRW